MTANTIPNEQTRIFDAVVDAIAMAAARSVHGVLDVLGLTHMPPLCVRHLHPLHQAPPKAVSLQLFLSAAYGVDLRQLAENVRLQVRYALHDIAGLDAEDVTVVFTEIVRPPHFTGDAPFFTSR